MLKICPICTENVSSIGTDGSGMRYCEFCQALFGLNLETSNSAEESLYVEIPGEQLEGFSHLDDAEKFALSITELSIEEAWNLISESHPLTKGKKPNVIFLDSVLGLNKNPYEFFEAVSIVLSDGGTLIVDDISVSDMVGSVENKKDFKRSFLSTKALNKLSDGHDLVVVDAERVGPKTRWYLKHKNLYPVSPNVVQFLGDETLVTIDKIQEFISSSSK